MKYIITETQYDKIRVLRRIEIDWAWITEMVGEGLDADSACDYKTEELYIKRIGTDSARTYLYNFFNSENDDGFDTLVEYISGLIKERLGDDIIEYYKEEKWEKDC
jgi:hypothetical protein